MCALRPSPTCETSVGLGGLSAHCPSTSAVPGEPRAESSELGCKDILGRKTILAKLPRLPRGLLLQEVWMVGRRPLNFSTMGVDQPSQVACQCICLLLSEPLLEAALPCHLEHLPIPALLVLKF